MNWTGGNLQRHSKLNANKATRTQQQHFPKVKSWTRVPSRAVSPIRLSTFAQSANCSQSFPDPDHDRKFRQNSRPGRSDKPPESYSRNLDSDERQRDWYSKDGTKSSQAQSNGELYNREESCFGQSFEDVKQRLLRREDWLGTSVAQPLKIRFPPLEFVEKIGRHRKIRTGSEDMRGRTYQLPATKRMKLGEARSSTVFTSPLQHFRDAGARTRPLSYQTQHKSPAQSGCMDNFYQSRSKISPASISEARAGTFGSKFSSNDSDEVSYETSPQIRNEMYDRRTCDSALNRTSPSPGNEGSKKGSRSHINAEMLSDDHRLPDPPSVGRFFAAAVKVALPPDLASTERVGETTRRQMSSSHSSTDAKSHCSHKILQNDLTPYLGHYHNTSLTRENLKGIKVSSSPHFASRIQLVEQERHSPDMHEAEASGVYLSDMHSPSISHEQGRRRVQSHQIVQSIPTSTKTAKDIDTNRIPHTSGPNPESSSTPTLQSNVRSNRTAQHLTQYMLEQKVRPPRNYDEHKQQLHLDDVPSVLQREKPHEASLWESRLSPMVRPLTRKGRKPQRLSEMRSTGENDDFKARVTSMDTDNNAVWTKHVSPNDVIESRRGLKFLRRPWTEQQAMTNHIFANNLSANSHSFLSSMSSQNDLARNDLEGYPRIQRSTQIKANPVVFAHEQLQKFANDTDREYHVPLRSSPPGSISNEHPAGLPIHYDAIQDERNPSDIRTSSRPLRLGRPVSGLGTKRRIQQISSEREYDLGPSFPFLSEKRFQNPSAILQQSSPLPNFRFPVKSWHNIHAGSIDVLSSQTSRNPDSPSDTKIAEDHSSPSSTFLYSHYTSRMQISNSQHERNREGAANPPRPINTKDSYNDQERSCAGSTKSSVWAISSYFQKSPALDRPRLSDVDLSSDVQANITFDSLHRCLSDDIQLPAINARDNGFRVPPELSDGA